MGEVKRVAAVGADDPLFEKLLFFRCLKAYEFAKPMITAKRVLEIGCGTCYGLDYFDQAYAQYVGMDIDAQLLGELAGRYLRSASPISFLCADVHHPPLGDHSFDTILSFQVIEHLANPPAFFPQAARLLRPGGHLLVTTPNRAIRLLPFQKPWNPEHAHEYSYRGFHRLLQKHFDTFRLFSVCGDQISFELECRRVKQDPYQVYFRRPLGAMARRLMPAEWRGAWQKHGPGRVVAQEAGRDLLAQDGVEITLNNFSVCEGDSPRSLDFIAVVTT